MRSLLSASCVSLALPFLSLLACGAAAPADPPPPTMPLGWAGWEVGLTPPQFTYLGQARIVADEPAALEEPEGARSEQLGRSIDALRTPAPGEAGLRFVWVEGASGTSWLGTLPARAAALLHERMAASGRNGATVPDGAVAAEAPARPGAGPEPATWSNGTDSRTRRSVADGFPLNHWPCRAIGRFGGDPGGCTGVLIGRRTVLTAAHCVYRKSDDQFIAATFRARRDPSNAAPYGAATVNAWGVPAEYIGDRGSGGACNKYDIAVVRIDADIGASTGGFGFGAISGETLEGYPAKYMREYPSCASGQSWSASRPMPCTQNALYGDVQACNLDSFSSPDDSGWNREITFSCDGSPSMSGSPSHTITRRSTPATPSPSASTRSTPASARPAPVTRTPTP